MDTELEQISSSKLSINIFYSENITSLFDYFVIVPRQTFENELTYYNENNNQNSSLYRSLNFFFLMVKAGVQCMLNRPQTGCFR